MDVMVLIDSFKGSMTSMEAGNAARDGVLRVYPHANVTVRPLADGGEGTTDALIEGLSGRKWRRPRALRLWRKRREIREKPPPMEWAR